MRRPGRCSPVTLILTTLLLLAIALGGFAILLAQRRFGRTANAIAQSGAKKSRVEIEDDCVLGSPECELVWVPDVTEPEEGTVRTGGLIEPTSVPSHLRLALTPPTHDAPKEVIAPVLANIATSVPTQASSQPDLARSKPPRDASLLPPAIPLPDSSERTLSSDAFLANTAHSMNPPQESVGFNEPAMHAERDARLVIIVGMGVHSGSAQTRAKIQEKGEFSPVYI